MVRRFYQHVSVRPEGEGFAVLLDGRPSRSPGKRPLVLPREDLAEAIAEEWAGQADEIDPAGMALTRFANTTMRRRGTPSRRISPVRGLVSTRS